MRQIWLHYMRINGDTREIDSTQIQKGRTVSLEPGGLHAMLIGLKTQIKPGNSVPVTLTLKDGSGKTKGSASRLNLFLPCIDAYGNCQLS
ncbi:MAG: copper chaperone PCu(A)C [Thiobacillus sp.]